MSTHPGSSLASPWCPRTPPADIPGTIRTIPYPCKQSGDNYRPRFNSIQTLVGSIRSPESPKHRTRPGRSRGFGCNSGRRQGIEIALNPSTVPTSLDLQSAPLAARLEPTATNVIANIASRSGHLASMVPQAEGACDHGGRIFSQDM